MNIQTIRGMSFSLALTGLAIISGCLDWLWFGVVTMVVLAGLRLARNEGWSWATIAQSSPDWIPAASLVVLLSLNQQSATRLLLAAAYIGWVVWRQLAADSQAKALAVAGINQFLLLTAIFSGSALRHWDAFGVIVVSWLGSYLVANQFLTQGNERSRTILAGAWALVVAECAWVFSIWLVSYVLLWVRKDYFIIPQPALILTALAYCYGGIYLAHRNNKLSRGRLLEYLVIALALLATVIAGTEWTRIV